VIGVHLIDIYPISVCFIGIRLRVIYFMGVCLMGVYLTGVYLIGIYLVARSRQVYMKWWWKHCLLSMYSTWVAS
jgi:hypothetical protein